MSMIIIIKYQCCDDTQDLMIAFNSRLYKRKILSEGH